MITPGKKRKRAIEVTSAHADTVILAVESNERCYDDIEFLHVDRLAANRFPEPEFILRETRAGKRFTKKHLVVGRHNREENALFCAPCALDDCTCIYFVPGRNVTGDLVATQEVATAEKPIRDYS